jgi:hypothetical protein
VGETRGSGNATQALNFTSRFDTHRFFEGTGITLPVSFVYNDNGSRPRFTAGDDVVRSEAQQAASETRSISRGLSTSYTRAWSERSHPLLRYTLGGFTGNISRTRSDSRTPSAVSRSEGTNAAVNWALAPRNLLQVPLPFGRQKLFLLPERVYSNYSVSMTRGQTFTRAIDGSGALLPTSNTSGRQAGVDFGADSRPLDFITHNVSGRRNLTLAGVENDKVAGLNVGRLVSWRQAISGRLSLARGDFFRPNLTWGTNYNQNNDVQSADLQVKGISNGQTAQISMELPFARVMSRGAPARTPAVTPPPTTPADSTGAATPTPAPVRPRRVVRWQDVVMRLGDISADFNLNRNSSYSRVRGVPTPLYLFGLAENPGFDDTTRVVGDFGNIAGTGLDWRSSARTRVPLAFNSGLQMRFSFGDRTSSQNGVVNRTRDMRFPDLDVDYGRVAQALRLDRVLQNPTLRTAYSRSTSSEFQNSREVETGNSVSHDFRPLLSVRGRFKNGADVDLKIDQRSTRRDVRTVGASRQTGDNTDVSLTLSRSYTQGQKVSFLGRESTIRASVNLQLATAYSRRREVTRLLSTGGELNPLDETRLSINGTGSYGFSQNVTGNVALGFSENRNHTRDIINRSVRVELRAQFTF